MGRNFYFVNISRKEEYYPIDIKHYRNIDEIETFRDTIKEVINMHHWDYLDEIQIVSSVDYYVWKNGIIYDYDGNDWFLEMCKEFEDNETQRAIKAIADKYKLMTQEYKKQVELDYQQWLCE